MRPIHLLPLVLLAAPSLALAQELGPVIITEIMYNPHDIDIGQEWVEVYNPTAAAVDIGRWALQNTRGRTGEIPLGTSLAAGEIAIIAPLRGGELGTPATRAYTYTNTAAAWTTAWGTGIRVIFVDSFWNYPGGPVAVNNSLEGLHNAGDTLQLINRQRVVIDQVIYNTDNDAETPWPDGNDSGSIQLLRDFCNLVGKTDNNNGAAWRLSGPLDGLGSTHATTALPAFPGINSYGTPGRLPTQLTIDCNGNAVNDAVDIVHATAVDAYPYNNIPDSCEGDCNANAVPDKTEIWLDWRKDRNANGTVDACEINAHGGVNGIGGTWDLNVNGVIDSFETKPNIVITEIMYDPNGNDEGKEFVEIRNAGAAAVDISGWALRDIESDPKTGMLPAGTIMQPGEVIVLMAGDGPGVPTNILTQFRTAWNIPAATRVFALTPWQDRAQRATPIEEVLAIVDATNEPVDVVNYENPDYAPGSTWPWPDTASSITLLPTALNKTANDLGTNWVRSIFKIDGAWDSLSTGALADIRGTGSVGSPGVVWTSPHQTETGQAVITEIMFHPNSNPGDDAAAEWIEVYNPGTTTLDLSGWYLRDEDGRTGTIAAGTTLPPHHVIILLARLSAPAATAEANFRAAWGNVCHVASLTGWSDLEVNPNLGGLANNPSPTNEFLTLRRADGTLVDEVDYDDSTANGWPADSATAAPGLGTGWSISLIPGMYSAATNNTGASWVANSQGLLGADLNVMNAVFNGFDIASPGKLEGVISVVGCPAAQCGPADLGGQGGLPGADLLLDNNDFVVFINYFFTSNPLADFGSQGGVPGSDGLFDNNDFVVFINAFFAGC